MRFLKKPMVIASIIGIPLLLIYICLAFFVGTYANSDSKKKSDAIVVLGARSYIDGKYNPCLSARVEQAADLYKAKFARKVLMTGGNDGEDNVNEAETMKKIAIENGVSADDIILETDATSTYENLLLSKKLLSENELSSVIIVTEPFHILRAGLVAKKLGYDYTVSPAQESPCGKPIPFLTKYYLKEPLALLQYRMKGRL